MMADRQKEVFVYAGWTDGEPLLIGKLYAGGQRGKQVFSFAYEEDWLLKSKFHRMLDPDLDLYSGRQYAPMDKAMFGIFADSCPDRWGRLLMKRREAITARREKRKPKQLGELDFLLGVYDQARMGALRFAEQEGGPFLSNDKELATPP